MCCLDGLLGDATVFIPIDNEIIHKKLEDNGYEKYGNEILYNGFTGRQIDTEIFIGPTYYFRLKHMVAEKINSRGIGAMTQLTRQPTEGRRKGGGLRIGEMERDTVLSHGISMFLKESMMERSDKYMWCACKRCGTLVALNITKDINVCKNCNNDDIVAIQTPYAFKLLIQEFEAMGIQLRLNTDEIEIPYDKSEQYIHKHKIGEDSESDKDDNNSSSNDSDNESNGSGGSSDGGSESNEGSSSDSEANDDDEGDNTSGKYNKYVKKIMEKYHKNFKNMKNLLKIGGANNEEFEDYEDYEELEELEELEEDEEHEEPSGSSDTKVSQEDEEDDSDASNTEVSQDEEDDSSEEDEDEDSDEEDDSDEDDSDEDYGEDEEDDSKEKTTGGDSLTRYDELIKLSNNSNKDNVEEYENAQEGGEASEGTEENDASLIKTITIV
jgi:hypothetical protein